MRAPAFLASQEKALTCTCLPGNWLGVEQCLPANSPLAPIGINTNK